MDKTISQLQFDDVSDNYNSKYKRDRGNSGQCDPYKEVKSPLNRYLLFGVIERLPWVRKYLETYYGGEVSSKTD